MVEAQVDYTIPFEYKKIFSPQECTELVKAFKNYDKNNDGTMDASEFKQTLKDLGHGDLPADQVEKMLSDVDRNQDHVISFPEFLAMFKTLKAEGKSAEVFEGARGAAAQVKGHLGSHHTYLLEEVRTFTRLINFTLKDDEDVKDRIPMNPDEDDVFHVLEDGVVLCKLINAAVPDTIDMRVVNKGANINIYKVRENLNLACAACTGIGIKMVGIDANAFLDKKEHLILSVLTQLAKIIATKSVSLKDCPEIYRLLNENEELSELNKLQPDQLLLRWMNFHLKNAGSDPINNLGKDLADGKAVTKVLNQLDERCTLEALSEADDVTRCNKAVDSSKIIDVADVICGEDLNKGNAKVNVIFVGEMFNAKHGLQELTKEEYEAAQMIDDDIEGSIEERQFRLWINSLNIDDLYVNDIFSEASDGLLLLKVIHKINPNVVEWNRVEKNPNSVFKRGINCQVAIDACKKMNIVLAGIGAEDIRDSNRKLILAIVWQLVRIHYLQIIGSKTENDLVKWANELVKDPQISNLKDKSMKDGRFLIKLCGGIEPRAINWDLVTPGETEEDAMMNAKYAISVARKLGAVIFMVWDDIPKVNYKMILIFVASLYEIWEEMKNEKKEDA